MYKEIAANKRKSAVMLLVFLALVSGMSWLLAAHFGSTRVMPFVLIGALGYALISYVLGSKLALAVSGAHPIGKRDNPRVYRIVENLSITEGLLTPKIYVIEDKALNAFATGRDPQHSSVAVTTGLTEALTDTELEGVLAHEMGHVKNYDIRVTMLAFALVAAIGLIADILLRLSWFGGRDDNENSSGGQILFVLGIVAAILAPLVATLIQLAISRKREYLADATGALATRYPEGLASALEKIKKHGSIMRRQNTSTAHLFFVNPLKGHSLANLFSTHPPVDERIKRLRAMIGNA